MDREYRANTSLGTKKTSWQSNPSYTQISNQTRKLPGQAGLEYVLIGWCAVIPYAKLGKLYQPTPASVVSLKV